MSTKFYQLTNLPELPQEIIKDGLADDFEYTVSPFACAKRATLFNNTEFCKLLKDQFGTVGGKYLKNPPNSYYDWHVDKVRNSALNWIIKTNPGAKTFHRSNNQSKFIWDLEEVIYNTKNPTLLNTAEEHCVFNNYHEDRIILSVSIVGNHKFEDVVTFLKSLNITQY